MDQNTNINFETLPNLSDYTNINYNLPLHYKVYITDPDYAIGYDMVSSTFINYYKLLVDNYNYYFENEFLSNDYLESISLKKYKIKISSNLQNDIYYTNSNNVIILN